MHLISDVARYAIIGELLDLIFNTRDFYSVRLATQGVTYFQRCIRQSTRRQFSQLSYNISHFVL